MNNSNIIGRGVRRAFAGATAAAVLAAVSPVLAQPAGGAAAAPRPAAAAPALLAQPVPVQPAPAAAPRPAAAAPALLAQPIPVQPAPAAALQPAPGVPASGDFKPAAEAKPDALALALTKQPGGLTLDEVARIALKTKPSLRAKQADLKAAAAKVDQAFVSFFPRVSATFQYTRLSPVENPFAALASNPAFTGGTATVIYPLCPDSPKDDPKTPADEQKRCQFYDAFSFTASLLVPVSDYLLRITQGYSAASHAEKSKKNELEAETLIAAADAKVAYLNWVRAKGQVFVAKEAVALAKAHVEDVKRLKQVGLGSQADVLRVEAQVAAAEQAQVELEAFSSIAEEQIRIGLALPKDKALAIGIDVFDVAPPAALPQLSTVQDQALEKRLEIRALDETELSLKQVEKVSNAGLYPRVDAFADVTLANPNQRYTFSGQDWNTTWDAGVRVSWTFNDTFTSLGASTEAKARVTQISEQKKAVKDGLRLEVAAAYAEIKKSGASIDAATRGLTAAEESLRVRRELFQAGKATNVEMLDAETEVTRGRLRKLDAQIGLIVNQIKYDHAIGNDVGTQKAPEAPSKGDDEDASVKKVTNVAKAEQAAPAAPAPGPLLPLK